MKRRRLPTSTGGDTEGDRRSPGVSSVASSTASTLFLLVILSAQMMVVLDTTIVNVALPHIQDGLHFSGSSLSWVLNAYVITFGGLLLLGARAGDLLGRRRTFLAGIALFSLSSLAGGFAVTSWMLLGSRALQGVGAALAAPSSLALLTTAFPEGRARVRAIGLYTTVAAAGGAVGLVSGGLLTQWFSWRWVMFVNVPIGIAVFLTGRRVLAETPVRHGRFDFAGAAMSTLGMVGVVLGLVEAGSQGWSRPTTFLPLLGGAALLAGFILTERKAEEPILPLRLLTRPTASAANVARGLVYAGMYGIFFFLTQFLQEVQGYSPLRAGVSFLPVPISVFLSSQLTSKVLAGRVRPKILMLSGIALASVALALSTRTNASTPYWDVLVVLVLLGFGSGISLVSLTTASLAGVDPADAGAASGLINVVQQIGAAVGLAVLVSAFGAFAPGAQLANYPSLAGAGARAAMIGSLDDVFAVGTLFAIAAFALVVAVVRIGPRHPAIDPIAGKAGAEVERLIAEDEVWSAA
jgi:EmrB/QacA subfamily drug resistance transporter